MTIVRYLANSHGTEAFVIRHSTSHALTYARAIAGARMCRETKTHHSAMAAVARACTVAIGCTNFIATPTTRARGHEGEDRPDLPLPVDGRPRKSQGHRERHRTIMACAVQPRSCHLQSSSGSLSADPPATCSMSPTTLRRLRPQQPLDDGCLVIGEVAQAHDGSLGSRTRSSTRRPGRRRRGEVPDAHRRGREHAGRAVARPVQPAGRQRGTTTGSAWSSREAQWRGLADHAPDVGLLFLSSPFSIEAVELLERVGMRLWKVASGERSNTPPARAARHEPAAGVCCRRA